MFVRNALIIQLMIILLSLLYMTSCSLSDGVGYGEDCPGVKNIVFGTGSVCDSNGVGECKDYLIYFEKQKCPQDFPKCESKICRGADLTTIQCGGVSINPLYSLTFCGAKDDCEGDNRGQECKVNQSCQEGICGCVLGQIMCGGKCVDPSSDRQYCGARLDCQASNAGSECSGGQVCNAAVCEVTCVVEQLACGGKCIDPQTDNAYCGASSDCLEANAGRKCRSGEVCSVGVCGASCVDGQIICNGRCIDPEKDINYCGASLDCQGGNAGNVCLSGHVCSAGVCQLSCAVGQIICGGKCVDPKTDNGYCGASSDCQDKNAGIVCPSGYVCSSGVCGLNCPGVQIICDGKCVDPKTENSYCGASSDCQGKNAGAVCPSGHVCSAGVCGLSCAAGQVICAGKCTDPQVNSAYCGAKLDCQGSNAGSACLSGHVCINGACKLSCSGGQVACAVQCIDPQVNSAYCGAKLDCQGSNAGSACFSGHVCISGVCKLSCSGGQVACAGKCIDPLADSAYCGAKLDCQGGNAGSACLSGQACISGVCKLSCGGGQIVCAGKCVDPQTSSTYCGASDPCSVNLGVNCSYVVQDVNASFCIGGKCNYDTCKTGYGNCNAIAADGCETDLELITNCGACKNNCTKLANVVGASCGLDGCSFSSCKSGYIDCDGFVGNGCETNGGCI